MWFCEDDRDEIWRRQTAINRFLGVSVADLSKLHIVPRMGHDNTLLDLAYGRPAFTPLLDDLREQVNDLKSDVLVLDNIAQIFGGNTSDSHHVTMFVNAVQALLVTDHCPRRVSRGSAAARSERGREVRSAARASAGATDRCRTPLRRRVL